MNLELPALGLVDFTWGNVSIIDPETKLGAIKPSGVSYDRLKPEEIVLVDLQGKRVEGSFIGTPFGSPCTPQHGALRPGGLVYAIPRAPGPGSRDRADPVNKKGRFGPSKPAFSRRPKGR